MLARLVRGLIGTGRVGDADRRSAILSRYRLLREVGIGFNHELVGRLSKRVLHEGARKLGMLEGRTIVFETEDESSLLMDYCIYDVRERGRTVHEAYLQDAPPPAGSDKMAVLQAMEGAIYSLFVVESVDRGFGIRVTNLLSDEELFVVDVQLSRTALPGLVLAGRMLFVDDWAHTSGAALPLGVFTPEAIADVTDVMMRQCDSTMHGFADPAPIIRQCRRLGASSGIRYESLDSLADLRTLAPLMARALIPPDHEISSQTVKIRRNEPCPCGSGKKYRHCCRPRDIAEK